MLIMGRDLGSKSNFAFMIVKGRRGGGIEPKFLITFILTYPVALSFYFPKWGQ